MADALDLGSSLVKGCGFKSHLRHFMIVNLLIFVVVTLLLIINTLLLAAVYNNFLSLHDLNTKVDLATQKMEVLNVKNDTITSLLKNSTDDTIQYVFIGAFVVGAISILGFLVFSCLSGGSVDVSTAVVTQASTNCDAILSCITKDTEILSEQLEKSQARQELLSNICIDYLSRIENKVTGPSLEAAFSSQKALDAADIVMTMIGGF